MAKTKATKPTERIVRFFGCDDSGEYGNAVCPHCGADGRYVYRFQAVTPEGEFVNRGAMAGCINLFPVSKIAKTQKALIDKKRANEKKGWKPFNRWDEKKIEAIEGFYAGTITEGDALRVIEDEERKCKVWVANKYGGRR